MHLTPPTKIAGHRHATIRYTDWRGQKVVRGGRAPFLWLWYVLLPLAAESTSEVEWRSDRGSTWHRLSASVEEAEEDLLAFSPMSGAALVKKARAARRARAARGA